MTTDVPSWIPSVEEMFSVCEDHVYEHDAEAIRALVAERYRQHEKSIVHAREQLDRERKKRGVVEDPRRLAEMALEVERKRPGIHMRAGWPELPVIAAALVAERAAQTAPERQEKAGEDLRECPTWYELRKAVESATTKWAREQFEGVDTSLADAEDAAVRELWNRRAPAQPARSTREERFNKSNALVQRAKPLIEALWAGAPTKPADSRMWLEAWTEHMKGHLSTCGYVQFDGMRVAMTGECLCPGDATPKATDFDDMEGRGPCGGSRCFLSHARDGVWIHSSKSYRTCSVRRAAPSRGERREAPASVERDAALEAAAKKCEALYAHDLAKQLRALKSRSEAKGTQT